MTPRYHHRRHEVAADLMQRASTAPHTRELEPILAEAQHAYAAEIISAEGVEAIALRCARRWNELWRAAGCPNLTLEQICPPAKPKQTPLATGAITQADMDAYGAQRARFKRNRMKWGTHQWRKETETV